MPSILQNILAVTPWLLPLMVGVMALCLAALWRLRWRDYALPHKLLKCRKGIDITPAIPQHSDSHPRSDAAHLLCATRPRLSVVIPCCNQLQELQRNLPFILAQDFDDFEVIIVDDASNDNTRGYIEHLATTHTNLRHTFVPASAHYVDRRKLALTLGIKAARAEWVVLTQADCRPTSDQWLAHMAAHCYEDTDFVLGYANYEDDYLPTTRRAIYERLRAQLMRFRASWRRAIGGDAANMAVRKTCFLDGNGYTDSLTIACGEDDLLVDALATSGRTLIAPHPDATMRQNVPEETFLKLNRIAQRAVLKKWSRSARRYLWREGAATLSGAFFVLSFITYISLRCTEIICTSAYSLTNIPTDALALLLLVAALATPFLLLRHTTDSIGERRFSLPLMLHYAAAQPWRNMVAKWKHRRTRREFARR